MGCKEGLTYTQINKCPSQRNQARIKGIQIGKKQGKLSLLVDDMLLFVENYKFRFHKKAIRINKLSKVVGYKIQEISCIPIH